MSDSARSQVRRYLADLQDPGPDGWRAALRGRSDVLDLVAHPAAVQRLRRAGGVRAVGMNDAASRGSDVVALVHPIPGFYVEESHRPELSRSLALREGAGPNLRIRVPKGSGRSWGDGALAPGGVGDAVLAADLLESTELRAVTVGAARLVELLSDWQGERSRA